MGSVGLVNRSSETGPPAGVVEADTSIKRHPVGNRRAVAFSVERGVSLLVGERISSGRGGPASGRVSRHKIRLHQQFSVLVEEQMLGGQVHLHIGISIVIGSMAGRSLGINRLSRAALPRLYHRHQLRPFLGLIDPPSVISLADGDRGAVGGLQAFGPVRRVVFCGQGLNILCRSLIGNNHLTAIVIQPLADGLPVQHLRLVAERIGDLHPSIAIVVLQKAGQNRIVRPDFRLRVNAGFLQGKLPLEAADRLLHCRFQPVIVRLISLCLLHNGVALSGHILGNPGIFRFLDPLLIQTVQAPDSSLQLAFIINHQSGNLILPSLDPGPQPGVRILSLQQLFQAAVKLRLQADGFSFYGLGLPAPLFQGQNIAFRSLGDHVFHLIHCFSRHVHPVDHRAVEKRVSVCSTDIQVRSGQNYGQSRRCRSGAHRLLSGRCSCKGQSGFRSARLLRRRPISPGLSARPGRNARLRSAIIYFPPFLRLSPAPSPVFPLRRSGHLRPLVLQIFHSSSKYYPSIRCRFLTAPSRMVSVTARAWGSRYSQFPPVSP